MSNTGWGDMANAATFVGTKNISTCHTNNHALCILSCVTAARTPPQKNNTVLYCMWKQKYTVKIYRCPLAVQLTTGLGSMLLFESNTEYFWERDTKSSVHVCLTSWQSSSFLASNWSHLQQFASCAKHTQNGSVVNIFFYIFFTADSQYATFRNVASVLSSP